MTREIYLPGIDQHVKNSDLLCIASDPIFRGLRRLFGLRVTKYECFRVIAILGPDRAFCEVL